ncbi:MAG: ribose-phosphate pyrophosphokinase [Theionarchaea archaeon]|nr:ribose-phosphate pyrophosphokinase [Theionarchaea archaeon]
MKLIGPRTPLCVGLARKLECDFVEMDRRIFPDGELNPRIVEAPREVLLVNTLSSERFDPNRYLLEFYFSIKNLTERGTESIVVLMPYLPYSRQDAVFREGESFTSKYVLELFRDLGIGTLFSVTFHLHRQQTGNFVPGITLHDVSGIDALRDFIKKRFIQEEQPIFIAPDEEAEKWARRVATPLNGEVFVFSKRRNRSKGAIETQGEIPEGRDVVIVDDMISTGGTIRNAVNICRVFKSKKILVCAVHGISSQIPLQDIDIVTTNTIDNPFAEVDMTPYLAEALSQYL